MSRTLLNAAKLKLQGDATAALGALEILLKNPAAISEHTNYVEEIIKHTKQLSENEEALKSLIKYFPDPEPTEEEQNE